MHKETWVHFPLPHVSLFRQLDRFLGIWNYRLSGDTGAFPLKEMVDLWSRAAWIGIGPDCRYEKFAMNQPFSEEENAAFKTFRTELFANHCYLNSLVTKEEDS